MAGLFSVVNDSIWSYFSLLQHKVDEEEQLKKSNALGNWFGGADEETMKASFKDLGDQWAKQFGSFMASPAAPVKLSANETHSRGILAFVPCFEVFFFVVLY